MKNAVSFAAAIAACDNSHPIDIDMAARRGAPRGMLVVMPVPTARREGIAAVSAAILERGGPVGTLDLTDAPVSVEALLSLADVISTFGVQRLLMSGVSCAMTREQSAAIISRLRGCGSNDSSDSNSASQHEGNSHAEVHESSCGSHVNLDTLHLGSSNLSKAGAYHKGNEEQYRLHQQLIKELPAGGALATVRTLNLSNAFLGGFSGNAPIVQTLADAVCGSNSLQHLDLSRNRLSGVAVDILIDAIIIMSRKRTAYTGDADAGIASLSLDWNDIGPKGALAAGRLLSSCSASLRKLSLAACGMQEQGARAMAVAAGASPSSDASDVTDKLAHVSVRSICEAASDTAVGNCGSNGISSGGSSSGDSGNSAGAVASSAQAPPSAHHLTAPQQQQLAAGCDVDLSFNHISAVGLSFLAMALLHGRLPVVALRLRNNDHIGDQAGDPISALASFMQALATAPRLRVLDLSGTRVPLPHMSHFVNVLKSQWCVSACTATATAVDGPGAASTTTAASSWCPPLAALNLNRCCVGMHNVKALCALTGMSRHHPLRILCLRQCDMGERGAWALKDLLEHDKQLRYLQIGQRFFHDGGSRYFVEQCGGLGGFTRLRTEPWPLHLKVHFLLCTSCNSLPQSAASLVFSYLRSSVHRWCEVDCG